ncbi:MerR family transcriptional regulator [Marinobacter sp. F3R08]|uniref:MerR family transcriptional regulator n=1 Tax=Marinobacter sp. F3R08 TaxID=2841559 RepID=UPI001C0917AE|nr:MerR family transcriptional regulator [Marinobacter sp. F3R08]MBU2952713.1 MerR family transcriptional regulator [Marinobacter sp. F3R08]
MKISEFEKKSGISRDTIRYYEKIGLITPPARGVNGYRNYGQVQLEELAFIQKGQKIGFTLTAIKEGYRRYRELGYFCPEFKEQLREKKAQLSLQISNNKKAIAEINKMLR